VRRAGLAVVIHHAYAEHRGHAERTLRIQMPDQHGKLNQWSRPLMERARAGDERGVSH